MNVDETIRVGQTLDLRYLVRNEELQFFDEISFENNTPNSETLQYL